MLSLYGLLNDNFGTSSCCNLVGKNVNLGTFFQNRCALSLSVLTPVTDIKKLLSTMSFLLKNYPVVESVYLSIRYNKTKFFLQIQLIKMVQINKTHTHTHTHTQTKHSEKDHIGKGVGPTMNLDAFEFLFFYSAREASNDVNTFLNLRFIKKQKPAAFLRKYYMLTSSNLRFY